MTLNIIENHFLKASTLESRLSRLDTLRSFETLHYSPILIATSVGSTHRLDFWHKDAAFKVKLRRLERGMYKHLPFSNFGNSVRLGESKRYDDFFKQSIKALQQKI